jgi:N12 class adenine-specific DNA methylase
MKEEQKIQTKNTAGFMDSNVKHLYDAMISQGYTGLGDFSNFEGKMKDSGKRRMVYDYLIQDDYFSEIGDFSKFESALGYSPAERKDYVSQSSVNPAPIALRQEVDVPMKDQSEYVNPWTNSPDYNFESLRKKGKIETATPPPPTEYEKDSSLMNTWAGDAIQKLNAGGADLGAGIFGVLDKAAKGLESATGGLIPRGGAFKDISDRFKADAEFSRARSNRYNGKDFTDLWKEGNYMGAIGDIALQGVESLPMSIGAMAATMAGAPAAGLAGIGSIVASQKYDDLDQNNPNMGEFAKVSNAILTGTAESLSEMLGAGVSKAWMSTLFKTLGKEKAQEAIKRGIMGKMQEFYKKFGMFFEPVNEGIEEVSSTLAENITDKITGADPERDLTDGVLQSFVYGMGGGAYFTGAGALAKGAQYVADKIGGKQAQQPITDSNVTDQGVGTPPLLTKSRFAEAEEEGRNMTDPGNIRTASKKMEETRLSLSEMVPGLASTIESYVDDKASEAQVMSLLDGVNADARPLAEEFYADYLRISGLQDRIGEEIDNEVETYVANNITPYVTTNPDGQSIVTTATLSEGNVERPVYVRSIEGDKAVISDNGQDRMVSVKRLSDIVEQDAGHMRRTYEDQLLATRQSELDMTMHHNPKTQLPKPGLIVWNGDNAFILQGQDENGDWIAQPAAYDRETGQVTAKNGSSPAMPITENEILDLQDAIYDAQQVNVVSPKDDNVASADAEITSAPPVEDAINQPTSEIETESAIDQIAQPSNVENPSMVMREDGTPDFVSSGTDMALDFLYDKYGDKMPRKIEVTRKSFDESLKKASDALGKAQEAYDDAPIGKEDKPEAALIKARQEYEAIKVEADFWANLDDDIKEASKKPGDVIAKEISVIGDPMSGEELAAMMLANGAIKLTRDSYKKETGAGNNETARMFGLFASPEKGGVNIERAGEILELADRENGTNFFDENDTNAGRDAIIEVLSSAHTRGDLIDYVKRNREAIAERERQAEYNAYAEWCEENYHMSPEEYEAYEESMVRDFSEKQLTDEERGELDSQIVDEIQAIIDEQNEIDAILAQNKPIENENIEGNDESGGDGLREGGGEVLPREQLDQTGRAGETEAREQVGTGIDRTDGATQEGASIIDKIRYSSPVEITGNEISPSEDLREYKKNALEYGKSLRGEYINKDSGKTIFLGKNAIKEVLHHDYKNVEQLQSIAAIPKIIENAIFVTSQENTDSKVNAESFDYYVCGLRIGDVDYTVRAVFVKPKDGDRYYDHKLTRIEKGKLIDSLFGTTPGFNQTTSLVSGSEDKKLISILQDKVFEKDAKEAKSFVAPSPKENENPLDYAERIVEAKRLHDEELKVDTNPSEAQKEAGNYKKGHVKINGFDVSIEQPAGSVRSGKDASGKEWSQAMNNTYGYIRGTKGVDGDHIDVFLGPDMNSDMVYVVDQVNTDGSFDEHKVMMGFSSLEDARSAYLSNYEEGWQGLGNITGVALDEFKKWIDSSIRKTKPFSDYKMTKENPNLSLRDIVESSGGHIVVGNPGLTVYKKETVAKKTNGNKLVSEERYEELKKRMRAKLGGQMNMGIDPEILAIGTEMAVYHIEKGLRKFSDYSKAMIDDLGDAIRPYLKSFYNGARDLPEVGDNGWDKDMTTYEDVRSFDVANFDKPVPDIMDAAETVIKETEIAVQASAAEKKIKNSRKKRTDNKDKPLPLYGNDLFTPNNIKDNEQGNSRADQGVGRKAREEDRGSERGGDRGGVHGSDVLDTERGRGIPISDSDKRPVVRNQNNFSFPEKGIELPSGDISKLKANIEAIETLKDVEDGQGKPTPEQQAKMSRYVGWGGLAEALNEAKYNARDNNWTKDRNWNDKYLRYYEKLKSLLSKEEFDSAVRSTTTSHYTPSEVVESLWGITEKLGFKGGNISEPAMGIGNIIGMMPRSISENSSISGFEIDSLSGRMAKALYPDANIKVQGYEKAFSPNSKDLVITNVPFGKNAPYDKVLDKQFRKKLGSSYNLHNYFILKGLLELKEGGLGVFVTSSATMDGADSKFREYVSGNGYDLVGAIRLPNDAFQKGAGTSVTADIVIFRKRKYGEPSNGIGFATTTQIGEGTYMEDGDKRSKPIMVNEYFSNHPDMMLGDMMTAYDAGSGGLYSGASQTLKAKPGADLSKELFNAIDNLPKNILSGVVETKGPEVVGDSTLKDGTITVQNGNVFVLDGESLKPIKANPTFVHNGKTRKIADAVNDYNDIKKNLYDLIHDEQTKGVDPEPARKRLNKVYDAFVSKYGTLNRNKALDDIFAEDVEHGLPFSLETVRRVPSTTGKSMVWEVSKADGILNKRVSYPFELPTKADNVLDAVNISKSYKGNIDIPYISEITGMDEVNVTNEILEKGIAYRDPVTGNIIDKSEYLSGNVKDKLVEAKAALEDHPEFQKNVDDLEAVQPERIPYGEISYRLGTTWIPSEFINNFADNVLGISYANANFIPEIGEYILDKRAFITDYAKAGQFKTERMDAIDVFKAALNQRKPKVYDEIKYYEDGKQKTRRVVNEQETQAVAEKISDMSDKFVEYIDSKTMFHGRIEDVYNDKYNNYVLKKYDKPVFEHYPNANKNITLRDHQSKAVQRCLSESTLLAHQVGTGKTFTMITSAMEMRRLGIAKKPMIVVQNATLEDFVRDFYKLYPSAKILSPTKEERNADNRTRLFNLIATGDFDAIVVPQSFMAFIPDSEERKKAYIQKRIDDFEEAVDRIEDKALQERLKREAKSMRDSLEGIKKGKNVKGKAKTAETITAKTERILDRRTDNVMTFEQMGVDALFIDEAHNYKKIGFPSKMSNVKGIDTSASQRANSMLLKAQWISENNGGRNVVLATGTPITNTMAEVWTMMNFVAPDILDAYNINSFDEFATTFGTVEPSLEFTATGNFKIAERFKSYTNVPELIKAFRSHTDVVLTEDVKEFKEDKNIPKLKDNKMTNVIVEKNEDLEDVMQTLIKELEDYNKLTGKEKKDKSALPLVVFSKAKQAAIDLRLLNPTFPDNPDSKTNKVVDNVLRLYKESDKDKGTQLIFCDSYQSPSETPKMDLFDVDLSVPQFNLYNDIKEKLIKGGIPSNQIAIVGNYEGERRNALFDKVRNGDVRILIGSTEKMGVGVNVQDRLFALHHIDAPIRPMDFEQRNGRILRQGNLYATWDKPVNIVTYGVKGTLDATAYDRLRIKQNFINQMMKGDISSRVMEEQDDSDPSGMTFSEMAATLSGDKTAQLLFVAQNKLKKLQNSKRSDLNSKSSMRDSISNSKLRIQEYNSRKDIMERNANIVKENFPDGVESVTVKGNTFSDGISNELTPIIDDYYDRYTLDRNTPPLKISLNGGKGEAIVHFNEGMMVYSLYLGKEKLVENRDFSGGKGLMASIDRQLGIPAKSVSDIAAKIKAEENKIAGLEEAVKKPWGKEDELNAAQAEVNDLQRQLVEKAKAEDIQLESTLDVDGTLVKEEGETRFRFMGVDTTNNQDNVSSIESSINDWSNKLNTPVRVIHDVDDINDTDENMLARKRDSKGWYDTSTGEIVIVSPNSTSVGDAQRTFLHEVVGHHGLRELFGDDFDTFLDNVYRNANEDIRKNIIDRTKGNPLNLREATEEYIAELAERGFDNKAERSLWEKIKDSFLDMLRKAGISLDFKLSDNDLRYILWRSYKNLEQGNLMDVAEDIVMRNRLSLNNINLNENGSIARDIEPEKGKQPSETKGTGRELETIDGVDENGNESERDHIDKPRGVENAIDGTENATDRNGKKTDGQVDNDGDQLGGGDTGDRNGSVRDGIGGERTVIGRAGSENKGRGVGESVREKTDDFAFAEKTIRFRENARNESVLFADNDIQVVEKQVGSAKDQYERTLSTSSYQFQEAFQDSMLGLKTLQDAVAKATRSRILDYENAYMAENALSSVNEAEFNAYRKAAFEPILKAISRLEKMGSSIDEIRDYLITKHGIERNREMAVKRALSQNAETYKSLLDEYIGRRNEVRENGGSWEEQQSEMDRLAEEYGANLSDDFSGFTSMYPNEDNTGYDPDSARRYVLDYESRYDTSELSASVKRATDAILAKQRDSGLMSQNTFDSISDMYQFYVPLRGWEETTADEVYAYLTSESQTFNAPIKTVVGRKSKADDPIATIANMAESGIMQGNRNLMKQKFLTMVQNHKTDLVSVSEMWVRLDEASGEWIAVFPDIPSNANPEQVESIVESFNKRMEELSNEKGSNVRRSRDAIGIPYKILPKDLKEHQVIVKRAGKEYVLTINGNPRAAQALNGLTNPDNTKGWFGTLERYAGWLNRNLAANFTTRNPNFMVSNFLRDALYSNTTVWVKESPVYAWKFNKNFAKVNPINMYRLVKGYENGTLDMSDPLNKAYHDFVMRGGETGYTNLRDVEAKKKAIQKELQYSKQKVSIGKALKILGEWMDLFNKSVENCARFAAFLTSREIGRSMDKSIYDAKEISVNFNKKGAGSKFLNTEGQTKIGNASAFTSGLSRSMYVFWNAGVQGMYNFGRLAKDNPKKFLGLASSFYLLGTIMPMIAAVFGDDEDDDYYDLPEYVRRNNICFRNGGGNWITIPMPIELRAIYGLGEMSSGIVSGKEKYTDKKMAMKIAEQMSQVLPLDMMEGGGGFSAFVPSSVKPLIEAGDNKDWTGLPLYKDNDFNKGMPEWTKAFKSVDPAILAMTKYANELTGGDKYTTGTVNLNPAIIEHILDGYFGGIEATRSQMVKSAETAWGSRDFDWRNIPVGNRLIKSGDERTKKKAIDNAYYENLEEMDKIGQRLRGYRKELSNPQNDSFDIAEYQKKLNDLMMSDEYRGYVEFNNLNKLYQSMGEYLKKVDDERLEMELYDLKAMMNEIANGK